MFHLRPISDLKDPQPTRRSTVIVEQWSGFQDLCGIAIEEQQMFGHVLLSD